MEAKSRGVLVPLLVVLFALLHSSPRLSAQVLTLRSLSNTEWVPSLRVEAHSKYDESQLVEVGEQQLGEILRARPSQLVLHLPQGIPLPSRIELDAFDVLTPDAKAFVVDAQGSREVALRERWISYRGTPTGNERLQVLVNITPGGIDAVVESELGRHYIRMAKERSAGGSLAAFVFPASALKAVAPFLCGVSEMQARTTHEEAILHEFRQRHKAQPQSHSFRRQSTTPEVHPLSRALQFGPAISTDTIEVSVALEGDYELFLAMGSSDQAALDLMMATATFASGVYLEETGVMLTVPFIRVWATEAGHPYGHVDLFKTMEQFMEYWKNSMNHVDRTIAHLFTNSARWTNVSGFVGIAQLDALCNNQIGYGVTEVRRPEGDGHLMTFAHEVGHNFGARHTHSCFWPGGPIDQCAPIEDGGCYSGPPVQSEGTIMSYCQTRSFVFGQTVSEFIRRNAEFAVCAPSKTQLAVAFEDSTFLNEFYVSAGGPAWNVKTNWDSGPVLGRTGVTVRGGRVIGLSLSANNLSGSIPASISSLTALRRLNLSGRNKHHSPYVSFPDPATDVSNRNNLTGSIPSTIAQLAALEELDLSNNALTGDFPGEITSLVQLRVLNLSENFALAGSIPPTIGNLSNLEMLDLWRTGMTGTIPSSIGNLTTLRVLILSDIRGTAGTQFGALTGAIPPELGMLPRLTILDLSSNKLSGTIPPQLGSLTSLTVLHLQNNELSGSLPPELASLVGLSSFTLSDNELSGGIPSYLGTFSSLSSVSLQNNQFSGPIPPELGNLDLLGLHLENNQLTGPIPPSLGRLTSLIDFAVEGNELTGAIPDSLRYLGTTAPGDFGGLLMFRVGDNRLTGPIPSWLAQRPALTEISLGGNLLDPQEGPIPEWVYNRVSLVTLHLHEMGYSGPIPTQVFNVPNLQSIKLSGNKLSGTIPTELANRTTLNVVWLSNNELTGSLPDNIGNLASLRDLRLSGNQLTGQIPSSLGEARNMVYLHLHANSFSGAVPATFERLGEVRELLLHSNEFTDIPRLFFLGRLRLDGSSLTLHNNRLTFGSLEELIFAHNQLPIANLTYAPQKPVGEIVIVEAEPGSTVTMSVVAGGTNNAYQRFKDGAAIGGATASAYSIASLSAEHAGQYTASVTNAGVPGLTLYRSPYIVSIYTTGFPHTVGLHEPSNGATGLTNPVTLVWHKDELTTSYEVQVDTTQAFNSTALIHTAWITDTTLQLPTLSLVGPHHWRVRGVNSLGTGAWSEIRSFSMSPVVSVEDVASLPTEFMLKQNYPNPFNPSTTIEFSIPTPAASGEGTEPKLVTLKLYDLLGREAGTLVQQELRPGTYRIRWDAAGFTSGMYVYRLTAGSFVAMKRLLLLK